MSIRQFEDLVAWQLAHELQNEVFAFTALSPCAKDRSFCDQIRASSRSATHNIAEGFGRYYPKEIIRFLRIAVGSLHETKSHLRDGNDRAYLSDVEHTRPNLANPPNRANPPNQANRPNPANPANLTSYTCQ